MSWVWISKIKNNVINHSAHCVHANPFWSKLFVVLSRNVDRSMLIKHSIGVFFRFKFNQFHWLKVPIDSIIPSLQAKISFIIRFKKNRNGENLERRERILECWCPNWIYLHIQYLNSKSIHHLFKFMKSPFEMHTNTQIDTPVFGNR